MGIAFAARARWPRVPLGALIVASLAPDVVDFMTAALRICGPHGRYSHSLPAIAIESVVLGGVAALWRRSSAAGWLVVAMVVLHLIADYITGVKILWAGGPVVGLDLYSRPLADFALEAVVTFIGWRMLRSSATPDRHASTPIVLALLFAVQAALDAASYVVGPVKPNGCEAVLPAVSARQKSGAVNSIARRHVRRQTDADGRSHRDAAFDAEGGPGE